MPYKSSFSGYAQTGMSRRSVLKGLGAAGLSLGILRGYAIAADAEAYFTHGVASGDPLSDRAILWTRIVPRAGDGPVAVACEVAMDNSFSEIVARYEAQTDASRDFIVKLDATGLMPNTKYAYRFIAEGVSSPTGHTQTLPVGDVTRVKMAVVSCSNYPQGNFHVYREISERDVNVVLHLGDYIYEYEAGKYDNPSAVAAGRHVKPTHEIVALEDYRMRYGLYRSDPDLQAVHAAHPFICVWDDHEIANDTWETGAENHNEGEGDFATRKAAALKAYREWLPVRDPAPNTPYDVSYRAFEFGNLAQLIMMDTRLVGRSKGFDYQQDLPPTEIPFDFSDPENPVALTSPEAYAAANKAVVKKIPVPFDMSSGKPVPMTEWQQIKTLNPKALPEGFQYLPDLKRFAGEILSDSSRTMLGETQEKWVREQLASHKGKSVWQIFGQQVLMGNIGMPNLQAEDFDFSKPSFVTPELVGQLQFLAQAKLPFNLDAWDGYPAARARLFSDMKAHAPNPIVLAGDTHNAWASNLKEGEHSIGVEMATAGVSSPGLETYLPVSSARVKEALKKASPNLEYTQPSRRGWLELELTPSSAKGSWYFVDDILSDTYTVDLGGEATVAVGQKSLSVRDYDLD